MTMITNIGWIKWQWWEELITWVCNLNEIPIQGHQGVDVEEVECNVEDDVEDVEEVEYNVEDDVEDVEEVEYNVEDDVEDVDETCLYGIEIGCSSFPRCSLHNHEQHFKAISHGIENKEKLSSNCSAATHARGIISGHVTQDGKKWI